MTRLPDAYAWLAREAGPLMLLEALKLYGTVEAAGAADNPVIEGWADELGDALGTAYAKWSAGWYDRDSIPWCGLFMAVVAQRANRLDAADRRPPAQYLSAAAWGQFGQAVRIASAELGDVLVFTRAGGGHVGLYVGEDDAAFHVLGGNQSDAVTVTRIAKARCTAVRRPPYRHKPENVRKVLLATGGAPLSTNEA